MAITNGYCTLVEVKAVLRLTDSTDDTLLENVIEGASRRVDGFCNRWFYKTSSTAFSVYPLNFYNVSVSDMANTTVTVKTDDNGDGTFETTWTQNTDYALTPYKSILNTRPYTRIVAIGSKSFPLSVINQSPFVQVTAFWGWDSIPDDVREATILLSIRGFARYNAALGIVGFQDMALQVRAVDPDVRDLLNPYKVLTVA